MSYHISNLGSLASRALVADTNRRATEAGPR